MFCSECGNFAANKALRKLGINGESKVYTFDGNTDGKVTYKNFLVKISNDTPDLKNVAKLSAQNSDGETAELTSSDWAISEKDGMSTILVDGQITAVAVAYNDSVTEAGLYVLVTEEMFVFRIETESITPIDQKYLPGSSSGVKIFNLSDYGINMVDILMSGQTVTAHDCKALIIDATKALSENKIPVLYDEGAGCYATINSIAPNAQIAGTLFGSMDDIIIKADVVISLGSIHMFTSELPIE